MIKKAIQHFNRALVIGLEVTGFLAVLFFLLWCGLIWRLSQGPLDIGFLTDRLEHAMNSRQQGFRFDVGGTLLTWGGRLQPFEVEMRDVVVTRAEGAPVLSVDKLGVQLSKRHLIIGRLMPKVIRVYGPSFRVVRWEDGHLSFNLDAPPLPVAGPPLPPEMAAQAAAVQVELVRGMLAQLRDRTGAAALLGGLREIAVRDAEILYEDKLLGASWQSPESDIRISRRAGGLEARAHMAVDIGAGQRAVWTATAAHVWETETTEATVRFYGLDLARISEKSDFFAPLAGLKVPLRGAVKFALDRDFHPGNFEFVLGGEKGSFSGFGIYAERPLPISSFYLEGKAAPEAGLYEIGQMKIDTGGPRLEARGRAKRTDGAYAVAFSGELVETPMDDLHLYWPAALAPLPREWVTEHLSAGTAHRATIHAGFSYNPAAEENKLEIGELGGEIFFDGIKVDYFPPLMPVQGARGRAYYDAQSFNLEISGGSLGDMTASKAAIHITEIGPRAMKPHAEIDIAVSLAGPLKTALAVLDSEPLGYPKMLGIKSADVCGMAEVDVTFRFPIHRGLEINDVAVEARATLRDVLLQDVVAGLALSGGPMDLQADNGAVSIKGKGRLGGAPVDFDWTKNFSAAAAFDQRVMAELPLTAEMLKAFGVPEMLAPSGRVPSAKIAYTRGVDGTAQLDLSGGLGGFGFSVPQIGFTKAEKESGNISLRLLLHKDSLRRIEDLSLETAGLLLDGNLSFAPGPGGRAAIQSAALSNVMFGETQVALEAEDRGRAGYALRVTGRQFDASRLLGGREDASDAPGASNTNEAAAKTETPLQVEMAVDRLILGPGRALDQVKLVLHRNQWQRIEQLETDATVGGKPLYLRYMPAKNGHSLRFEADNAGAALSTLGITRSIRGGTLAVKGEPDPQSGPRDLRGTAVLRDFTLRDTPVLAKLLNAMSLVGILDLLNGEGLSFTRAIVNFTWTDRGQPQQFENLRRLRLRDGRTSGTSLGLTFEGEIDYWKKEFDLDGTIIPVSEVSSLISGIPLVGDILTAGGEGLLAATYTIRGPMSQPVVMVNPLAVLAPGILRKIFFEN